MYKEVKSGVIYDDDKWQDVTDSGDAGLHSGAERLYEAEIKNTCNRWVMLWSGQKLSLIDRAMLIYEEWRFKRTMRRRIKQVLGI